MQEFILRWYIHSHKYFIALNIAPINISKAHIHPRNNLRRIYVPEINSCDVNAHDNKSYWGHIPEEPAANNLKARQIRCTQLCAAHICTANIICTTKLDI